MPRPEGVRAPLHLTWRPFTHREDRHIAMPFAIFSTAWGGGRERARSSAHRSNAEMALRCESLHAACCSRGKEHAASMNTHRIESEASVRSYITPFLRWYYYQHELAFASVVASRALLLLQSEPLGLQGLPCRIPAQEWLSGHRDTLATVCYSVTFITTTVAD